MSGNSVEFQSCTATMFFVGWSRLSWTVSVLGERGDEATTSHVLEVVTNLGRAQPVVDELREPHPLGAEALVIGLGLDRAADRMGEEHDT
jgi:hypothetical protein